MKVSKPSLKGKFVYILSGITNKRLKPNYYVGKTTDLLRRTKEHQMSIHDSFQLRHKHIKLQYFEQFDQDLISWIPQIKGQEKTFKELFNRQKIFGEQRKKWFLKK